MTVDGIFIKQDFDHLILDQDEIDKYTTLMKSTMKQTLFIPFKYDIQVLNFYLHSYFAEVRVSFTKNKLNAQTPKYDIKFTVEDIEIYFFNKAKML